MFSFLDSEHLFFMPCLVVKTRNTLYSVWALVFLTYERLSKTKSEFLNHFIACRWNLNE